MQNKFLSIILLIFAILLFLQIPATAQEEYTGSIISFNGPRLRTAYFTLRLTGLTSDEKAQNFLSILKNDGQNNLLDAIDGENLGSFSIANNIAPKINVVRKSTVGDSERIFVVFARWTQFAEQRYGSRSLDYPFGVIEIFIDPKTGKGEGTYIAAAGISWDDNEVEIENFATYPARLLNVSQKTRRQ